MKVTRIEIQVDGGKPCLSDPSGQQRGDRALAGTDGADDDEEVLHGSSLARHRNPASDLGAAGETQVMSGFDRRDGR